RLAVPVLLVLLEDLVVLERDLVHERRVAVGDRLGRVTADLVALRLRDDLEPLARALELLRVTLGRPGGLLLLALGDLLRREPLVRLGVALPPLLALPLVLGEPLAVDLLVAEGRARLLVVRRELDRALERLA